MQDIEVEDWVENLSKKNTKKVTGSIHQKELKERGFINGILNGLEICLRNKVEASPTVIRLELQKVLAENYRDNHSDLHMKTFDLEGFLFSFKSTFNIKGLRKNED